LKSRASSNPAEAASGAGWCSASVSKLPEAATARRADGGTGVRCGATTCDDGSGEEIPPQSKSESVVLETASGRLSAGEQVSQWQAPPPMAC